MAFWRHYHFKNLTLFLISILFAVFISRFEAFHNFLLHLGNLGYFGAFIAGALFVSTFTIATGAVILLVLAEKFSPIEMAIFAGLGSVVADFAIFHLVRDNLEQELELIYNKVDSKHHFIKLLHTRYFSWTLPVIGAIVIASPLPDEIGVTLLGISKMKTYKFLALSFLLNATGIFLVVSASRFIKP